MNLHEYQAKELLRDYKVPLMPGYLAYTPNEAQKAAVDLGGGPVVVKAQIHAGGRGKGGGVKLAEDPAAAHEVAESILGMMLKTPQTGAEGRLVRKVLVEQAVDIAQEYYLSLLVDRKNGCVAIVASAEGGMEIEELAENKPEALLQLQVRTESGLLPFHLRRIAQFYGVEKKGEKELGTTVGALYKAFLEFDCDLLEINPLVRTTDGCFLCLDAKMTVDDNALFRQARVRRMVDYDEIDDREIRAGECGLSYIALDGNIGCMVNGAGLAMATMDLIKQAGGEPANFLDVGGGASKEMVCEAFKILLGDDSVKAVLVNIFGGIMHCDVIAQGILAAAEELNVSVPLVVRLAGTNVELGKQILDDSALNILSADDMGDAAAKVVAAARSGSK